MKSIAIDEKLGDPVTHLMKTGSLRRSSTLDDYANFTKKIPRTFRGVDVKYDIWWDTSSQLDKNTQRPIVTGFSYTDMLSRCVFIKPMNSILAESILKTIVFNNMETIDHKLTDRITACVNDKYKLNTDKTHDMPERVVFLPGTNMLHRVVDNNEVHRLVYEEGAKVKPHPLTSKFHVLELKHELGAENVIDKDASGFQYLSAAKTVFCCTNSELGLAAFLLDKSVCLVEKKLDNFAPTYKSIYSAIMEQNVMHPKAALLKLLSSEYSGLIFIDDKKAKQKIINHLNSFNLFTKVRNG